MPSPLSPPAHADVVVLAGGDPVNSRIADQLPQDALVIAADSGLHHAGPLQLHVHHVVGDLDSVDQDVLERAIERGAQIDRYPVDKDRTDLAIALALADTFAPSRLTIVGGHGGRLDHFVANLGVVAAAAQADRNVIALMGDALVTVVTATTLLHGEPGETVSLVTMFERASGVTTDALRFPLHNAVLEAGSSRGVSNAFVEHAATVSVQHGTLLAIQPDRLRRNQ